MAFKCEGWRKGWKDGVQGWRSGGRDVQAGGMAFRGKG